VVPARSQSAYEIALKLLARRDLSTTQVRDRLAKRQFSTHDIESAIARLTNSQALDDTRAAISYARRSANVKLRGKRRTHQELLARGIDLSAANHAVAEVFDEVGETVVLERAIRKRLDGPVRSRAQFRRLYQALLRQGFPPEEVASALISRSESNASFMEE